jgi:hypothetical protein
VLAWTMMFDDDKSVLAFLDHCAKRFAQFPDAKKPVAAERYMKFPSTKLADVADNGKAPVLIDRHPEGKHCPATTRVRQGTVLARVFGRALDKDGKPLADTVRQEHYVEDRFHVPVAMQQALAKALADVGTERFRLADDLARLLVSHAFLGQLDVNPLGDAPGSGKGSLNQCEFWARKVDEDGNGPVRVRVEGKSEAAGGTSDAGRGGDRAFWRHEVKLTWEGIIEINKERVPHLLLVARGSEKLKWGNKNLPELKGQADVTILVGGHAIDLSCGVRYGIIGAPVAADEAGDAETPAERSAQIPDEASKQLVQALGASFIVFRDKVQEELKLSDEQKQKLEEQFPEYIQETMEVFEKIKEAKPEEREKTMQKHRKNSDEKLSALLKDVLEAKQQQRLFQLKLQQEGTFALMGENEAFKKLKITDEQRKQIMGVVHDMHKKIESLIKEAQPGGNPQEIMPKVMKIRTEHESRIEAILTDGQKSEWRKLLGKSFDFGE